MKKITKFTVVLAFILGGFATFAQAVLVVPPGIGTLNAAIAANLGTKIYQLQAGQFYQLNAVIENVGYHLQIIGEVPAPGMPPATLQTNDLSGVPYAKMFDAKGDLTLKNVYFVNAAFNDVLGTEFIQVNAAGANITLDKIILNPVGINNGITSKQDNVSIYVTNSLVMNHGTILSPNDGHFVNSAGSRLANLLVENNTFVAMGTTMFHGGYNKYKHGVIKWNHNTWVMQKSQIDWSTWEDDYVFTNNLMYDFNTQPWSQAWQPSPGAPATTPKPGLIMAGPQIGESLPVLRKQYIQYNNLNRDPGFYTLIDELNVINNADGKPNLTFMPLIWDATHDMSNPDVAMRSRETILFADKTNYPNWNFGNTFDTDPQFVDPKIYAHSTNFVKWTKPATLVHAMGKPAASVDPVTTWAKWQWYEATDPTNPPSAGNNSAWPPFNGVYTNPAMLTASLESLPLGDLNWFPAQKAIWMNNKSAIDAHVASGNTNRIAMLGVKDFNSLDKFGFSYYPNPVKNQLNLSAVSEISEVSVYNLLGQEVMRKTINSTNSSIDTSNLSSGSYVIKVVIEKTVGTYKIVKE